MPANLPPVGALFDVTEVTPCHHADLAIEAFKDAEFKGPMLVRFCPKYNPYRVTSLNAGFVAAMIEVGRARLSGFTRHGRTVGVIRTRS